VEVVRRFIGRQFAPLLDEVRTRGVGRRDFKSALQERLQSADRPLPEYRLVGATGPDHDKRFLVRVLVAQTPLAEGAGQSKKEAEQEAARLAIDRLDADADAEPTPESKP
jgi:ribonuclease-3